MYYVKGEMVENLINVVDVAKNLNVNRGTLDYYYKRGIINIIRKSYHERFITIDDFEKIKKVIVKEKSKYCKMCFSEDGPFCEDRWQCLECHKKYQQAMREKHIYKRKAYNKNPERMKKQLERANKWYENHTEEVLQTRKVHYDYHKNEISIQRICKKYNITKDEYEKMLAKNCEICGGRMKKMCIDHDHTNGKIRGMLCDNCNRGIGFLKDDPKILQLAINYLIKTKSKRGEEKSTDIYHVDEVGWLKIFSGPEREPFHYVSIW